MPGSSTPSYRREAQVAPSRQAQPVAFVRASGWHVLVSFFFLLGLLVSISLGEGTVPTQIDAVHVGFAGRYKAGLWTPVRVTFQGDKPSAGTLTLTAPDGEGVPSRVSIPCSLPGGNETSVLTYVRFGRAASELAAEFRPGDGASVRKLFATSPGSASFAPALASGRELIVTIGTDSLGAAEAASLSRQQSDQRPVVASLSDASQLPDRWCGYEGIDALVLSASRPERFAGLRANGPQIAALALWVQMGGKLLIAGSRGANELFAAGKPLAPLLPGKFRRNVSLRQSNALEEYSGSKAAVPRLGLGDRLELRAARLESVEGTVEAREGSLTLVVRRSSGFGQLIFVAIDLDEPPVRAWEGRGLFVRRLLDMTGSNQVLDSSENAAVMHYGFDDMAGQLRSALDRFPAVPPVPFSLVVALVVACLFLVGPFDYFFLKKFVGRMVLTWVTLPLVVLGFSAGAFLLAHRLKGDKVHVNQINLVDVDAQTGLLRGTAWANLFSPRADRYDLEFQPNLPEGSEPADRQTSWLGLPGEGLGGMHPKTAALAVWKQAYDFSPGLDAVRGVPIPSWSTRSLTGRWAARTKVALQTELHDQDQVPTGTIASSLAFPLSDCRLCYGGWVYGLGTMKPGETIIIRPSAERRDLKTFLTGRKLIIKEGRELNTPYERSSTEPAYVLHAMMFFEAAGGRQYTGLWNRYQEFVDLSGLLKLGRAIFIARAPSDASAAGSHGARLLRDGQAISGSEGRNLTVYRFVLPVQHGEAGPGERGREEP